MSSTKIWFVQDQTLIFLFVCDDWILSPNSNKKPIIIVTHFQFLQFAGVAQIGLHKVYFVQLILMSDHKC